MCLSSDIIFVQEHWLLRNNSYLIKCLHTEWDSYFISGVIDIENYALNCERPYGGIGFLWQKSAAIDVKLLAVDKQHCLKSLGNNRYAETLGQNELILTNLRPSKILFFFIQIYVF